MWTENLKWLLASHEKLTEKLCPGFQLQRVKRSRSARFRFALIFTGKYILNKVQLREEESARKKRGKEKRKKLSNRLRFKRIPSFCRETKIRKKFGREVFDYFRLVSSGWFLRFFKFVDNVYSTPYLSILTT